MERNYQLLKDVLSVPSKTYKEEKMVQFIVDWLNKNEIECVVDEYMNVYATKTTGPLPEDFMYPCVVSHTDTVHNLDSINVVEEQLKNAQGKVKLSLKAYNDKGKPTGIGGDDKCGVYACLELLKELPNLKAAFFVSEETGCHGSRKADKSFFANVGYAIQFDAPENWMITERCWGTTLFDRSSEFFKHCNDVLVESFPSKMKYFSHPYTDVYALKESFDFSCINISIGYYQYHTANEYVVVDDVYNGINVGKQMIEKLGYRKHIFKKEVPDITYPLF
jgi:putative aminopeptidase FrvX